MFQEQPFEDDFENLDDYISRFEDLLEGRAHDFISEEAFVKIVEYYEDQGNIEKALKAVNFGIERFPYYLDLKIRKIGLLNAKGLFRLSFRLIEELDSFCPTDSEYYINKIEAYLGLGRREEALKEWHDSESRFQGEELMDLLLTLSEIFDDWDAPEEAVSCLFKVLKEDPQNAEALSQINMLAAESGKLEESIQLHHTIIDEFPYNAQAWFNLGFAFQEMKLYEKAIDAYEYVLVIEEGYEPAKRNIADALIKLHKYNRAIEVLEDCIQRNNNDSTLYEALGFCYEKKHQLKHARTSYKIAFGIAPDDDNLYYRIGNTFMMEEQWKKAVSYLTSAVKLNLERVDYFIALAGCYSNMGLFDEAIDHYITAIDIKPANSRPRLGLVHLLYETGLYDNALQQINEAILEARFSVDYLFYKTVILLALGRTKDALLVLEAGLNESPKRFRILFDLNPELIHHKEIVEILSHYDLENL